MNTTTPLFIKQCHALKATMQLVAKSENDTYNFTFAQIADFIEDNWQILVKEPI
jgi:hypothetical protein